MKPPGRSVGFALSGRQGFWAALRAQGFASLLRVFALGYRMLAFQASWGPLEARRIACRARCLTGYR